MPVVAFFGSSKYGEETDEYQAAMKISNKLAENKYSIVSGGYGGIMEAALRGASDHDVVRTGVITDELPERKPNDYVDVKIEKPTYADRLLEIINMADAYVVFPGGTGTLAELALVWALKERRILGDKPIVCYGEQWNEVEQIMSFYSETVIDNINLLTHSSDPEKIAELVINGTKGD